MDVLSEVLGFGEHAWQFLQSQQVSIGSVLLWAVLIFLGYKGVKFAVTKVASGISKVGSIVWPESLPGINIFSGSKTSACVLAVIGLGLSGFAWGEFASYPKTNAQPDLAMSNKDLLTLVEKGSFSTANIKEVLSYRLATQKDAVPEAKVENSKEVAPLVPYQFACISLLVGIGLFVIGGITWIERLQEAKTD